MSRPRAFSSLPALLLLSLIAFQAVSASRIKPQSTPQSTQTKTAVPSRANLAANSKDDLQEPEEPVYGIHEVPDGIVHVPEYDVREPGPSNRPHGSKQRPEDPDGYHTERPPSDAYNKHDRDDSPGDGDAYEKDKSPYGGPEQKPYDGPKEDGYGEATPQVPEAPCPKAMSADAVEDVLIKKASFNWKSLASQNPRRGRNTRRTARKASATDPADTQHSAQQAAAGADAAAVADSTTDGTVAAAAGAVSSGSSTVGIASQRAALRAAAAAGMPTSTASRMRVANPELAATLSSGTAAAAGSGAAAVGTAAIPAAGSTGATAADPAAASAGDTTAKAAEAAYDKSGLADAKFLLPVGPEVSGNGEYGTYDGEMYPTGEALAVGPHVGPQANPTVATLLHAVNAVAEIIFMSKKAGKLIAPKYETQIKLAEIAKLVRSDSDALIMGDPSAFFDCKDERWVLIWSSYPKQDAQDDSGAEPVTASLFVAVSHTIDPLEDWTVYALEARPLLAPGYRFCDAGGKSFSALAPQTSYSDDGIFISIGASCASAATGAGAPPPTGIMSTLFAYSKAALYDVADPDAQIFAATYMGAMSWKSSIAYKEQALIRDDYRTFNNLIAPARPQAPEDVSAAPLFVMKVDGAYMSVATLTDEPLDKMDCIENAPSIRAIVIGKGEDFGNVEGMVDGSPVMPQPGTDIYLDSGDTGMLGGKYGIRTYGTVHNKGLLYTTMSEYFGVEDMRMPSIYWAIISTHPGSGLCKASRKKWGFIASADGLALAYPVIAARPDGTAVVVYSYSGATEELPHSLGPAYPGVASSVVGGKEGYGYEQSSSIEIIKLGPAAINDGDVDGVARWGDYSASQVFADHMWFAVPIAKELSQNEDFRQAWRSWIAVEDLSMRKQY